MRRYQLSGLEHVHMMRHVPRSYDMTRTHILHKSVNKHVDVVLRCSPKNWKKKKVAVTVVRGEKNNEAARIRANARKGYVAVRKVNNEKFEADRKAAASAYETVYGKRDAGSDALIHDMKSQISAMARKSSDYIDDQLNADKANGRAVIHEAFDAAQQEESQESVISPESEKILREGGYRMPGDRLYPSDPYAADYLKQTSEEEFHILMDSLEKSIDDACRKYGAQPETPEVKTETGEETGSDEAQGFYSDYTGSYTLPNNVSLSVTKKQEIRTEPKADEEKQPGTDEFRPALSFTGGGEHYIPEDGLFDRELHRPGYQELHEEQKESAEPAESSAPEKTGENEETGENQGYIPPSYLFDDDASVSGDEEEDAVGMPEAFSDEEEPDLRNIFYTADEDDFDDISDFAVTDDDNDDIPFFLREDKKEEETAAEGYPSEDYEQQNVFFATGEDGDPAGHLYNPPEEKPDFAEPTMYPESVETPAGEEEIYEPPMASPDVGYFDGNDNGDNAVPSDTDGTFTTAAPEPEAGDGEASGYPQDDDDLPPPMIFPDDDEDLPPPMIFPDDGEEGYSPAPVSPDRNDYFDGGSDDHGVIDRSGQTLYSRSGDQIRKVIGVIRGTGDSNVRSKKVSEPVRNKNVEITFSDRGRFDK